MTTRCKAFFNGLEVQVEWEMTRSHGTSPDVGRIVFRQGAPLPSSFRGDLVLTYGDTEVVRFRDCILRRPQEKFARTRDVVYQVFDWRWKWATPRVFGQYNVRDENNALVMVEPDIRKNPQELAAILFRALSEADLRSGKITETELATMLDFSVLPTDVNLAPHVHWHYTPAAVELDKLCSFFACSLAPQNDGTFKIVAINQGMEPDNTNLKQPVETGLVINPAPDFVTAYAGDTWFESWLCLEPVGIDGDGEIKPIELLSYKPTGGWKKVDPKSGIGHAVQRKLRGTMTEELIDKAIDAANRSVFRMYRITGFPKDQMFWPGFTLEPWSDTLPSVGDPSKVYQYNPPNVSGRIVVWNAELNRYVGVAIKVTDLEWSVVDLDLLADLEQEPIYDITATRQQAENSRTVVREVVIEPEATAVDSRLILPLLGSRVETELDEFGKRRRKKAEICGLFFEDDYRARNKDTNRLKVWKRGFSVDNTTGIVTLSAPAYRNDDPDDKFPILYLRIGYGYRKSQYGPRYHRQYHKPTGNTLGIANGVVPRTDLNEHRVQLYTSDYNDLRAVGTPITNTALIDTMLEATATENIKQYQNTVAPKRKIYTPIRAIDLNGKVAQVSYSGGVGNLGETTVSIGESYDITQSPAKKKAMLDAQRKDIERNMLEFTDRQIQTLNMNQAPNVDNTFDASNIA